MKKTDYYDITKQTLQYLNYSKNTSKIYLHYISEFLKLINKPPTKINNSDIEFFLKTYNFKSISQQNQVISSLKFFYKNILNKKYNLNIFVRPKKDTKLPNIINHDYLKEKINNITNLKHKAIISLTYSVGLRVSEVINLNIKDIDSKNMIIHIKQAKGKKDRIVPLSKNILKLLRSYYIKYKPKICLFNGQKQTKYTKSSCNKVIKKYLGEQYHIHQLRHSCFTKLLEDGTDIRTIQKIAGHSTIKTTELYTQVSNKLIKNVQLPI